jgi:hypothetical protein
VCVLDAVVGAGGHLTPEATFCSPAVWIDVDYALHLGVIEEEAVYGSIAPGYEGVREAADVQALDAFFAIITASQEFDARVRVVGVELGDLVMSATAIVSHSRKVLPAGKDTCRGSTRRYTEACGCLLGLKPLTP